MTKFAVFDLASATDAQANGVLERWVHCYLEGPGQNAAFADGLRLEPRRWRGPLMMPLTALTRTCGPEAHMPFRVTDQHWRHKTQAITNAFVSLDAFPPLIVQRDPTGFHIRDGNHRYGAFTRLGLATCWVILWYANPDHYEHHRCQGFRWRRMVIGL